MDFTIRVAKSEDCNTIYGFVCLLEELRFDYTIFESLYDQNLANHANIYLVAVSNSQGIIGFISIHTQALLHHCGKVAEIQELFVLEQYRQLGIGRKLIQAAENMLRKQDCLLLEVTAQTKRNNTHAFYENAGFENTHKKYIKSLE